MNNQEFSAKYRIYYEDTDSGGVVYHANHLKFFERARTDLFREKSLHQSELKEKQNIIFMVRKCEIQYKIPAKLDDLIIIKTRILKCSGASMIMNQEMFRDFDQTLLNTLQVEIVCIDSVSMKPKRIPKDILSALF